MTRAAAHQRGLRRQLLQQREHRSGADADADEQQPVALGRVGGEDAVRPLDRDARSGRDPRQVAAVVAEILDGDAQQIALRRRRQRIRMRLPPQPAAQEPPLEELAAGHGQPVEPAPAHQHGDHARPLRRHALHADSVAQRPPQREPDPRRHHHGERAGPQQRPPRPRDRMAGERGAGVDLVRERQEKREVGVEVHGPPRLVGEAPARQPVRREAGGEQQQRARGGGDDSGIGPQQLPEPVQHAVARRPRVAGRDQDGVREQQVQRPRPEPAVPGDEPVLADRALERRHARDEHHDDDHRVGGEQPGQPPEGGGDPAGRAQRPGALGRHRQPGGDAEPDARRGGERVDHEPPPAGRPAASAHRRRRRLPAPQAARPLGDVGDGHGPQPRRRPSGSAPRTLGDH